MLDKETLLAEIQAFGGIDNNTWMKNALSGGMSKSLVIEILNRRAKRLARKYPFNFLERIYQTASMTDNVFNTAIRTGIISTTGEDVRIDSDNFHLEYTDRIFRIGGMRVDNTPVSFMHKHDVLMNRDKYNDSPYAIIAFKDHSPTKGKQQLTFLSTLSGLQIEMCAYVYPENIEEYPYDFYDYFKDIALMEILKEPKSAGLAAFRATIVSEFVQLEQELIAAYTRDAKIELVHEYNQEDNMSYSEISGGHIK